MPAITPVFKRCCIDEIHLRKKYLTQIEEGYKLITVNRLIWSNLSRLMVNPFIKWVEWDISIYTFKNNNNNFSMVKIYNEKELLEKFKYDEDKEWDRYDYGGNILFSDYSSYFPKKLFKNFKNDILIKKLISFINTNARVWDSDYFRKRFDYKFY